MRLKTKILLVSGAVALVAAGAVALWKFYPETRKPTQAGLEVLSYSPQGEEVPISVDGITVMFDRPIVPLTTLDRGRDKAVPLKITPDVDGKFFWLGTKGFIFRPNAPLAAATRYRIVMPAGVASIDGYRLDKPLEWEFSTVSPRILTWEPGENETLFPKKGVFRIRFNIAMNRSDVEKNLTVTDVATSQLVLTKKAYDWSEGGHLLQVRFQGELPWDADLTVALNKGVRGKEGEIGLKESYTVIYATPSKEAFLESVYSRRRSDGEKILIEPGKETLLDSGADVCFSFNQPVLKKTFEKAFQITSESKGKKTSPYFYFSDQETVSFLTPEGKLDEKSGYRDGCALFLDDYNRAYSFGMDPGAIETLSGAPFKGEKETYRVRTDHAAPSFYTPLSKNILSAGGPIKIPYRGINLKGVTLHLYRMKDPESYDEGIKGEWLIEPGSTWKEAEMGPPWTHVGYGGLSVPFDRGAFAIDRKRMPADISFEMPVGGEEDLLQRFVADLGTLPDGQKIGPGIYLIEALPKPNRVVPEPPHGVYTMIQVTPVALAAKRELNHLLVWATDIESGTPAAGLPLQLRLKDSQNQNLEELTGMTSGEGVAIFPVSPSSVDRFCLLVTDPVRFSYSCEGDHQMTGYRPVLGAEPHFFSYVYTDRPIYRPGQTVHFSSFIRQVKEGRYFTPPANTDVTVLVHDASGQEIFKQEKRTPEGGGVVAGTFVLEASDDTPRGEYQISVKVGTQSFNRAFTVASYRKPSFKVEIKAAKEEIVSGEDFKAKVSGAYFFGAPLRKSKTTWSIMTSTYFFSPEGYEAYNFLDEDLLYKKGSIDGGESYYGDDEYDTVAQGSSEDEDQWEDPRGAAALRQSGRLFKDPKDQPVSGREGILDDEGLLPIRYRPNLKRYPTSQTLMVEANVQDPSHQEVSAATDVIVHKAAFYLGVRPEKWVYGEKDKVRVQIVSLDTSGKPAGDKPFSVSLIRREYKYIERRTAGGFWDIVYEPNDIKVDDASGKTDGKGVGEVSLKIPQGGTYRLVVRGKDGDKNEIQAASTFYAWGEGFVPWRLDEPQALELVPDKESYKIGDTAKVLVKSLVPVTKALLTIERGRVLEYKVIDLGGTNASHLEIPVTEGMIPNLYVSVVAQTGRAVDHPPLLFYGETELAVDPEAKRLQVTVTPDRSGEGEEPPIYRPGDEVRVKVEIKDPAGKPVKGHVIVSVADESVLRLLDYQLPDLVKRFYFWRRSGVVTTSSMNSLKAGDSGSAASKKRREFKDTAHFEGHLVTDNQGQASFSFKLPDDLTTWVIEAIAASESKTMEAFERERVEAEGSRPAGQRAVASDLVLSDNTFVGGARGKIMTTLPVVLRAALPRFAVWGDEVHGQIIANNRNPTPVEGALALSVSGDALFLKDDRNALEVPLKIDAKKEISIPVALRIASASGRFTLTAAAKDSQGASLDALEVGIPVEDRYAPEVVATSGVTGGEVQEQLDLPPEIVKDKGGLDVSFKSSLGVAIASSLKNLIDFPWACSEQRSASLIAMLITRDLSERFGEKYFDLVAPLPPKEVEKIQGLEAKNALLDQKIQGVIDEIFARYRHVSGGIKYWPESRQPDLLPSAQVLWAVTLARGRYRIDENAVASLKNYLLKKITGTDPLGDDEKAFGLWALSLDGWWEPMTAGDLTAHRERLTTPGLAYLLMGLKNKELDADAERVRANLTYAAKHEPRHVSWPGAGPFSSSSEKNTALAVLALLRNNPADPLVSKGMIFLFNRKKARPRVITQDNLYLSWLAMEYSKVMKEETTNFTASLTISGQAAWEKKFTRENLGETTSTHQGLEGFASLPMPAPITLSKKGEGTLYYDLLLKYYLPPEKTPTREEGLVISREYYDLGDVEEAKPLDRFEVGENYKGHIVLIVPQEMNYVLVQDLLPSGFEPIDMTLATTSRAAWLAAGEGGGSPENFWEGAQPVYDDVVSVTDYGSDYGFSHQEIRDDAIVWSDEWIPPGVYHIRYPVRATTVGTYLMPGAVAFEFYEPEIFGRSRGRVVEITE